VKPLPLTPEILEIARGVIWFEPPEQALSDPVRFMAYAMTYATPEDMRAIRQHVSDDDFREALDRAPPGIIDTRSWAYWNSKMGRYPALPRPVRRFGNEIKAVETRERLPGRTARLVRNGPTPRTTRSKTDMPARPTIQKAVQFRCARPTRAVHRAAHPRTAARGRLRL
jgi:hypothetical protein